MLTYLNYHFGCPSGAGLIVGEHRRFAAVSDGRARPARAAERQKPNAYNRRLPESGEFTVFISSAYAQSAPAAVGGSDLGSSLISMLPLVLMFVVLYFVMIRPQMKRQKELKAMLDALAKSDEVVTSGGILGKIAHISDSQIGLEIGNGVTVQLQRSAVVQVLPKGSIK
jgi:preprotein translocase subunit YajC